jgi:predicted RNase H-like HicB family nuclease
MKYPVVIRKKTDENEYQISVPDLPGCTGSASSIDSAITTITDLMADHFSILAEYGEHIPHANTVESHLEKLPQNMGNVVWCVVDIDITPYLGRSHKINVTLPELLIKQIDDRVSKSPDYKTRSGFIASACLHVLAN